MEDSATGCGARRQVEWGPLRWTGNFKFSIDLGRTAFGKTLMLKWGATLGRNFQVNIGWHDRHAVGPTT